MTNSVTQAMDKDAKHSGVMANKVTGWSFGTSLTAVQFNSTLAVTGTGATLVGLDVHPSTMTYGWTVTTLTSANLKASAFVGAAITTDNTSLKVRVEADMAANKLQCLGLGSSTSK